MLPLLLCGLVIVADRPNEDDMFGGASAAAGAAASPDAPQVVASSLPAMPRDDDQKRDDAALLGGSSGDAFLEGRAKEDPLKIGGRFYLRSYGSYSNERNLLKSTFNVPVLVDAYLDARPMDRLRAQILGRLQYDPFFTGSVGGLSSTTKPANPSIGLDQAWIAFDIARSVFITAGRQHVKWGTARIFNPTDFLSAQFRDPLSQIDARLGVTMLKVSVPWEAKGWNFYAVALFEPTQQPVGGIGTGGSSGTTPLTNVTTQQTDIAKTFGDVGGAARAEFTFGNTQIGIDGLVQRNRKARAGLDLTTALGPIDVYGEVAVRAGTDIPVYRLKEGVDAETTDPLVLIATGYETRSVPVAVGATGGLSYDIALPNKRSLNLGAEYFFNSVGYDNKRIYPFLLFSGAFQPFYNGKHYAALTVALIDNGARVTTVLSNIGNLSDMSFVSRVDFSITVLSYLSVEAFAAVHYGQRGGEFRFAYSQAATTFGGVDIPAISIPAPLIDAGLGLRMSL
jgi:hypothetical protein